MKIYQIDAFSDVVFKGNPAAVVPLVNWMADSIIILISYYKLLIGINLL